MTDAERDFFDANESRARAHVDEAVARLAWVHSLPASNASREARLAYHRENVLHEVERLSRVRHGRDLEDGGPHFRDTARGAALWKAAQAAQQRVEVDAQKGR